MWHKLNFTRFSIKASKLLVLFPGVTVWTCCCMLGWMWMLFMSHDTVIHSDTWTSFLLISIQTAFVKTLAVLSWISGTVLKNFKPYITDLILTAHQFLQLISSFSQEFRHRTSVNSLSLPAPCLPVLKRGIIADLCTLMSINQQPKRWHRRDTSASSPHLLNEVEMHTEM